MNSPSDDIFMWQVNNAGIFSLNHAYDRALECMNVNYFGTVNLTEKLLPLFKESIGGARVINLSSFGGFLVVSYLNQAYWFVIKICCWVHDSLCSGNFFSIFSSYKNKTYWKNRCNWSQTSSIHIAKLITQHMYVKFSSTESMLVGI